MDELESLNFRKTKAYQDKLLAGTRTIVQQALSGMNNSTLYEREGNHLYWNQPASPAPNMASPVTYTDPKSYEMAVNPPTYYEPNVYNSNQSINFMLNQQTYQEPKPVYSQYAAYSQLELIKTIIKFKDSKNIPALNKKLIISKVDSLLATLGQYPEYKAILMSVKNCFKCDKCSVSDPDVFFSCSHQLCRTCFYKSIGNRLVPPSSNEPPLECVTCNHPLSHSDYSYVFSDWEERLKNWEAQERHSRSDELQCKGCERRLNLSCFTGCKCFCFECMFHKRLFEICSCGTRNNANLCCDVCRRKIDTTYIQPFFILCGGHIHCNSCFQQTASDLVCGVCKFSMNDYDIRKALKFSVLTCEYCKTQLFSNYFLSKQCCGFNICITCQIKQDNFACAFCKTRFNLTVFETMAMLGLIR